MRNPLRIVVSLACAAALGGCLTGRGELRLGLPVTLRGGDGHHGGEEGHR